LLVIDGQQRLTTVSLLIEEALARALGDTEPVDGFSAAKLRHYFLSNPLESGDRYFKLLLSQTDNASLKAIIKNSEQPKEPSLRVTQNFALFTHLLAEQKGDFAPPVGLMGGHRLVRSLRCSSMISRRRVSPYW
jgi:uncharacterized protein with ParB-like and HNH nuclease domain